MNAKVPISTGKSANTAENTGTNLRKMSDKELADKIVGLGVGHNVHDLYAFGLFHVIGCTASDFVRDWRVAGAALQSWPTTINTEHLDMTLDEMLRDPRAINEAWVERVYKDSNQVYARLRRIERER